MGLASPHVVIEVSAKVIVEPFFRVGAADLVKILTAIARERRVHAAIARAVTQVMNELLSLVSAISGFGLCLPLLRDVIEVFTYPDAP